MIRQHRAKSLLGIFRLDFSEPGQKPILAKVRYAIQPMAPWPRPPSVWIELTIDDLFTATGMINLSRLILKQVSVDAILVRSYKTICAKKYFLCFLT